MELRLEEEILSQIGKDTDVPDKSAKYQVHESIQEKDDTLDDTDSIDRKPPFMSAALILLNNLVLSISFSIVIPTSNSYVKVLGGSEVLSGLIIGLPMITALFSLYPMLLVSNPKSANGFTFYKRPYVCSCVTALVGHILYSLAFKAKSIALILVSRIILGVACVMYLYHKKFMSDRILVGAKYRTFMSTLNTIMLTAGIAIGPFLGGLMAKTSSNSHNAVWNQYTSGNWLLAIFWFVLFVISSLFYNDVDSTIPPIPARNQNDDSNSEARTTHPRPDFISLLRIFVAGYIAFSCFFTMEAYQASIPIYTAYLYKYSPFQSGNFLALACLIDIPFLLLFSFLSRWIEDRTITLIGILISVMTVAVHLIVNRLQKEYLQLYFTLFCFVFFGTSIAFSPLVSLLTKQLHPAHHLLASVVIQISIAIADTTGPVFGGAIRTVTSLGFLITLLALHVLATIFMLCIWKTAKVKTG
ncbi:major facilitator superfamily transporter [Schizosaccharomyces cryophilus OY26]|uniref:Major facilitator superfamily transporter n=1 Tax=Schizosaccharomyces cryophilus (strain OY26 / ATCC MYA-4695 / CBS 11777 / NBRC 106824 / NRRL Y48691) TaxID=653667 RepID=S9X319_SCHCR|nr:major facilitator superfamily transporter [Schizosaccharomyces cryophilus OY26]EPY51502.1 major facilitator superfamily transporter [Schizosaccharomyces cryophilus OY26]